MSWRPRVATVGSEPMCGPRNTVLRVLDWGPGVHQKMAMHLAGIGVDRSVWGEATKT
jgi:hypothetical protein